MQRTILIPLALALGMLAVPVVVAQQHGHGPTMVAPSELKWGPVPSLPPGAQIAIIEGPMNQAVPFTIRLKFPANYVIPAHSHPATERVTVLSGTFHIGHGDKFDKPKTTAMPAGGIVIMPVGHRHFAWTSEDTVVQLNGVGPWGITYVDPADDPRNK